MTAKILDGKRVAETNLRQAKRDIARLRKKGVWLKLAALRVGHSKDAVLYERYLEKLLSRVGIRFTCAALPQSTSEKSIVSRIARFNRDAQVTGILLFAPLPKKINHANVFDTIRRSKDVEGRTFLKSHFGVFSPTAHAVMTLIGSTRVPLAGKEAVVVGHSDLVGKPVAVLLSDKMATVAVCHKETKDLKWHVQRADILVTAAGKAHLIPGSWIKRGAVVIDVGENMLHGNLVGDVDFKSAEKRASYLTPVPGGVGPVTNVMLIKNLIRLHGLQKARNGNR